MRMLSKIIATAAFSAIVATVPARAEEPVRESFKHEGFTYVYKVKETAAGKKISGRRYPDAAAFNLNVKNGKVSGVSGGQSVSFSVVDAEGATSAN